MNPPKVLVVGAGLAGLSCALQLRSRGISCKVLEASDGVGGRARTDLVDGFRLDRGFQVLLTSYPDAQRLLDYDALRLGRFEPGALVRFGGRFHRFTDPWRRPSQAVSTALSPVATLGDKLRVARLREGVMRGALRDDESSTLKLLRDRGFSDRILERFFQPFFGGVFLDDSLETSSRAFEFLFRMFSIGSATLPAEGMGALGAQLAERLPDGTIELGVRALEVAGDGVVTDAGSRSADAVVVATDASTASKLLGESTAPAWRGTTCYYFAADKPPIGEPILVLNGEGRGPINSVCVPSVVVPDYAPAGRHLVSVSVVGDPGDEDSKLQSAVEDQLAEWFGDSARSWRLLRTYRIASALPAQPPNADLPAAVAANGVFRCGDYFGSASIQGALESGRQAADLVANRLGRG